MKTNSQQESTTVAEKLSSISKEMDSLKKENKETKNLISLILKHGIVIFLNQFLSIICIIIPISLSQRVTLETATLYYFFVNFYSI